MENTHVQGTDFDTAYKIYKPEQIVRILEKEKGDGKVTDFQWLKRGEEYFEVFIIKMPSGELKKVYFNVTDLLHLY
ncbi:MAG: hypothetical protein GXO27_05890 [Chlorobi bacterium]|nr:hypothetical protein [Chlorobiota bacterium]